jgi:hypothetical protein
MNGAQGGDGAFPGIARGGARAMDDSWDSLITPTEGCRRKVRKGR